MPGNLVHTYITGNSFPNIYGGQTEAMYGDITKIEHLSPLMKQRWPWMKGMWVVGTARNNIQEYFRTLKEATEYASGQWPGCGFLTRSKLNKQ
jgi:hypothetical protein